MRENNFQNSSAGRPQPIPSSPQRYIERRVFPLSEVQRRLAEIGDYFWIKIFRGVLRAFGVRSVIGGD
jgi:hypothetical protein